MVDILSISDKMTWNFSNVSHSTCVKRKDIYIIRMIHFIVFPVVKDQENTL